LIRKEKRYISNALVYLDDNSDTKSPINLLNLSEHGVAVVSRKYIGTEPNSTHILTVIPEEDANSGKFHIQVKSKWVKLNRSRVESGFLILSHFDEEEFRCYLDHLIRKSNANAQEQGKPLSCYRNLQVKAVS